MSGTRLIITALLILVAWIAWRISKLILKTGVSLNGVSWRMFFAAIVAENVWQKYGAELVITSGTDGSHSLHSMHYRGLALDFRTSNLGGRETEIAQDLQNKLGPDYAVILEGDHIHTQYSWENVRGYPYA